jgi:DHA1 family tetracycline resistance protein-like MFS transporter
MDQQRADQPGARTGVVRREAAFVFIFATILLDMLAMGIVIPVLPKLVVDFVSGDTQEAARIFGFFATAWALMQFLFAPLQGTLSDSFGRRPVILISNFGVGLDYVLMALAPTLGWLFAGRLLSGIASSSIATAYAYVTDVTPADKRAARFGLLGAAFGAGFVLGPALGGLAGSISPRLPFWIAAGLSLLNACYGLLVLPESLPSAQRVRFDWLNANPFGALALLRTHIVLIWLAAVNFLGNLAHNVLPSVSVLYLMYRYDWDERLVGLALAFVGISSIVVQAAIVGPVIKRIGERAALIVGLAFGIAGFLVFALARTGVEFCFGIPLLAIWGLESPASMALMSRLVGASEQGRLQGANASIMGLANLFGPALFTQTFALAIGGGYRGVETGAPFMMAALLVAAAAALAAWVTRGRWNELQVSEKDAAPGGAA